VLFLLNEIVWLPPPPAQTRMFTRFAALQALTAVPMDSGDSNSGFQLVGSVSINLDYVNLSEPRIASILLSLRSLFARQQAAVCVSFLSLCSQRIL
jgi:hypothetical protein